MKNCQKIFKSFLAGFCLKFSIDFKPGFAVNLTFGEAEFMSTNPIVSTETFERFRNSVFPSQTVTIDEVNYTHSNATYLSVDHLIRFNKPSIPAVLTPSDFGETTLSFGDGFVEAIGFNFIPRGSFAPFGDISFSVKEENEAVSKFTLNYPRDLEFEEKNFLGFSSSQGIRSISIGRTTLSDNYSFDDVSRSAVVTKPVPEPLTILGSGLALGFGVLMERQYSRKRKKTKQIG